MSWMVQPYQINSSGTLPGNTVINVGQGVQINGNTGTITLTNPTTSKVSIVLGLLPDGTYNLVIAKTGLDVYKDVF